MTLAHPLAVQNSTVSVTASGCLAFAAGITGPVLGGLTGAGNVALATAASQPVTVNVGNNGQSTTYGGVLSGAGGLAKQGAGIMMLTAPSTYSGPTVISGGVLELQAAAVGGSIGVHFVGNGSSVTASAGVVAMNNWNNLSGYTFSGSTLVNNSGQNSGATFSLSGAASVWATGSANPLLNGYVYGINNPMTLIVSNIPYARYSIFAYVGDSTIGNQEEATINGTSYYFATEGGTPITYTAITSTSPANYQSGNYIEVDGLSGASQTVAIAGTTQPYSGLCSVEIVNTTPAAGSINMLPAMTALRIAAGATLDLGGVNQQVASLSDQTPGNGGSVVNSGTASAVLTLSATGGSTTFSGAIAGGGTLGTIGLVMSGSGRQVLSGSNTYNGPTTVGQGKLVVDGWLTHSAVAVNSGGTLGGTGYLSSRWSAPTERLPPATRWASCT